MIKKFNDFNENSHYNIISDIKELCNSYLSYLSDDNFSVEVSDYDKDVNVYDKVLDPKVINKGIDYRKIIKIDINKNGNSFYWNEVSDDFIPFLSILSNSYVVECTLKQKSLIGYVYKEYKNDKISEIPEYRKVKNVLVYIK